MGTIWQKTNIYRVGSISNEELIFSCEQERVRGDLYRWDRWGMLRKLRQRLKCVTRSERVHSSYQESTRNEPSSSIAPLNFALNWTNPPRKFYIWSVRLTSTKPCSEFAFLRDTRIPMPHFLKFQEDVAATPSQPPYTSDLAPLDFLLFLLFKISSSQNIIPQNYCSDLLRN